MSKVQRWLDLLAYLLSRRTPATIEEIMEAVPAYSRRWRDGTDQERAAVRRMFERDKDELRRLGIPIQTVTYTINFGHEETQGYRLAQKDFYLPYLKILERARKQDRQTRPRSPAGELTLREQEARLAFEALRRMAELPGSPLREAARSAFRKMAFELDPSAFHDGSVVFLDRPGSEEAEQLRERLRLLSSALLDRKRVRFRYYGIYRDEVTERDVAPYGLLFQHGNWYLIGHDALRNAVRVFRVSRMRDLQVNTLTPNTPDYEIPADFRLDDYANRDAWELGGEDERPIRARVLFHFPASLLAERQRRGTLVAERSDGSAVRAFDVVQVDPFLRWILSFGGDAEILDPPELVDALRRTAAGVAALYEPGAPGSGRAGEGDA